MRVAVDDFGPVALIEMRVAISAVFLLCVTVIMGKMRPLITHWKTIAVAGLLNVATPFLCLAYAIQTIQAGTLSVVNAMVPMFGGLIASVWLRERLSLMRILGLFVGLAGIAVLMQDHLSFGAGGGGWVMVVALGAPFFYGLGACHVSKYLKGVDPIACATGSMISASFLLLPFTIWTWPAEPIAALSWGAVACLGVFSTGVAYVIFYHLVARMGASKAITVTFLVPVFGVFWGIVLLNEPLTINVALGAAIVLAGTLLATGFIGARAAR
jgi:drug/metabolite transporter (DMT)-like permease